MYTSRKTTSLPQPGLRSRPRSAGTQAATPHTAGWVSKKKGTSTAGTGWGISSKGGGLNNAYAYVPEPPRSARPSQPSATYNHVEAYPQANVKAPAPATAALPPLPSTGPGWLPGAKTPCCGSCATEGPCGGSGSMCRAIERTATDGKMQLQCLNNRLVSLLQSKTTNVDMSVFRELQVVIKDMKEETSRITDRYEREIKRLQSVIETSRIESSKEGAQVIIINDKVKRLEEELSGLKMKYRELEMELQASSEKKTAVEKEAVELRARIRALEIELEHSREEWSSGADEASRITIIMNQTKEKLIEETKKCESLEEEIQRTRERYEEERREWQRKIDIFERTIMTLESKISEFATGFGGGGYDINAILSQLRGMFHREMETNHQQTMQALHSSLHSLNQHMQRSKVDVTLDDRFLNMQAEVQNNKRKCVELEGQITSYQNVISALQAEIAQERQNFSQKIREMQQSMQQFYECYLQKTEECTLAREVQSQLQSEIAAFGAIIAAEERNKSFTPAKGLVVPDTYYVRERLGPGGLPPEPRLGPGGLPPEPRLGPGGLPPEPRLGPGGLPPKGSSEKAKGLVIPEYAHDAPRLCQGRLRWPSWQ